MIKINSFLLWEFKCKTPTKWSWKWRKLNIKAVQSQGRLLFRMAKVHRILMHWIKFIKVCKINSKFKTHKKSNPGAQPKTTCTTAKTFKKDQTLKTILQTADRIESSYYCKLNSIRNLKLFQSLWTTAKWSSREI